MEFKNDINKIREAVWVYMKNIIILLSIPSIIIFITLSFSLIKSDIDNIIFILSTIFLFDIITCMIFFIILYNNFKRKYLNYKLEVIENYILYENIKLETDDNCQILKDKNGNIIVKNKKNEIFISKYLNNLIELENILLNNNEIKQKKDNYFSIIMNWLPFSLLVILIFIKYINILELYIFIGTGFILTAICAVLYSIINIKEKRFTFSILINIMIHLFFIFIILRNIYHIMKYVIDN